MLVALLGSGHFLGHTGGLSRPAASSGETNHTTTLAAGDGAHFWIGRNSRGRPPARGSAQIRSGGGAARSRSRVGPARWDKAAATRSAAWPPTKRGTISHQPPRLGGANEPSRIRAARGGGAPGQWCHIYLQSSGMERDVEWRTLADVRRELRLDER